MESLSASFRRGDPLLAFLQAMPDGMVLSDGDGRIVLVNDLVKKLTGYQDDELIGQPIEILVPAILRGSHRTHRTDYYASGWPSREMGTGLEITLTRRNGTQIPVDIALSRIDMAGNTLVLSAIRDATERKRAEAVIRENERRWRTVLESVRLLVVGLDPDGLVTYANPFLRQLCGYSEQEILGRNWFEVALRDGVAEKMGGVFNELLAKGAPAHFVNPIWTKSGERKIVAWHNTVLRDAEGHPEGTLSIGEDITDRKRNQDSLEAVNEVAQAILQDGTPDEVLRTIATWSRTLVEGSDATVVTPAPETEMLIVRVAEGEHASKLEGTVFPRAGSVSDQVMRTREIIALEDASADQRVHQPVVQLGSMGPAIFAPLAVTERAFGTLVVARLRGARHFSDEDRIARELHDGVIQNLFATGISLQAAVALAGEDADPRIMDAIDEIDGAIAELRNYIFGLRRALPDGADVVATLERLSQELEKRAGVMTVLDVDQEIAETIEPPGELVQLVREALSNVARHAEASTCRLTVRLIDENVIVEIEDDGQGFDLETRMGKGQGLVNLHERAVALGATLRIDSKPGDGTVIRAIIPA
ncbi:MAG TPA: PAS domain S-box protein [Acidimicrobiia bacterium]|nr:PAS domain S-box protein [Acidimicrobiia bacterium]